MIAALLAVLGTGVPKAQEQPAPAENAQSAPADTIPPDLVSAQELMGRLEASMDSLFDLESRMKGADEEKRDVLRVKGKKFVDTINGDQLELLKLIPKLDAAGIPAKEIRARFERFIVAEADIYQRAIRFWAAQLDDHRERRASAEPVVRSDIEAQIEDARHRLDGLFHGQATTLTIGDSLGLDASGEWHLFEKTLTSRAENLVGRLQIAVKSRDKLRLRLRNAGRAGAAET
jgi:DNA-binding transcriptional MerR regulator